VLIRSAKSDRDRLMFYLAYFGGLRVSELISSWAQVIRRDSGEAQKTSSVYAHARPCESSGRI
jgi:site-specific recombinase XerD